MYKWSLALAALTCALTPAYTVRWHYGFYPTTLLETAVIMTLVVFALESASQRSAPQWRTAFTLPAALFLVAGAISVLVAPDRRAALGLYRAYLIEPIAFFIILVTVAKTARRAQLVLAGLGVGTLVVGIPNAIVVIRAILTHSLNLAGTPPVVIYQTSNAVALFLLPVIAVAAAILVYGADRVTRLASATYLALALPAFLLTFSRGGYLALLTVGLVLAVTHRRRVLLLAMALAVGALFAVLPPIASRIAHDINPADPTNTLVGRSYLWRATLQMLAARPLTGAGLSGFATRIAPYWNATHTDRFTYPHNLVLNFWTETGLLGVAAFGWLLYQGFKVTSRGWRLGPAGWRLGAAGWHAIHLGVLLALIGMIVHGLVDVPYWKNDLSLEFWALLGLTAASQYATTQRRETPPLPRRSLATRRSG